MRVSTTMRFRPSDRSLLMTNPLCSVKHGSPAPGRVTVGENEGCALEAGPAPARWTAVAGRD